MCLIKIKASKTQNMEELSLDLIFYSSKQIHSKCDRNQSKLTVCNEEKSKNMENIYLTANIQHSLWPTI